MSECDPRLITPNNFFNAVMCRNVDLVRFMVTTKNKMLKEKKKEKDEEKANQAEDTTPCDRLKKGKHDDNKADFEELDIDNNFVNCVDGYGRTALHIIIQELMSVSHNLNSFPTPLLAKLQANFKLGGYSFPANSQKRHCDDGNDNKKENSANDNDNPHHHDLQTSCTTTKQLNPRSSSSFASQQQHRERPCASIADMFTLLIRELGANANIADLSLNTPLHLLLSDRQYQPCPTDLIRLFVDEGKADPNKGDRYGYTAMHHVVCTNQYFNLMESVGSLAVTAVVAFFKKEVWAEILALGEHVISKKKQIANDNNLNNGNGNNNNTSKHHAPNRNRNSSTTITKPKRGGECVFVDAVPFSLVANGIREAGKAFKTAVDEGFVGMAQALLALGTNVCGRSLREEKERKEEAKKRREEEEGGSVRPNSPPHNFNWTNGAMMGCRPPPPPSSALYMATKAAMCCYTRTRSAASVTATLAEMNGRGGGLGGEELAKAAIVEELGEEEGAEGRTTITITAAAMAQQQRRQRRW